MNTEHPQKLTVRSVGAPLLTTAAIALLVAMVAAHKAQQAQQETKQSAEDKSCAA